MGKLVRIKDSTYNELAKRGTWSDTMDSIIQRLLYPQKNHGIDDTPKKSEREERPPLQESNGDGSSIRNCDSTSRANIIPDAIAEYQTTLDAVATGEKEVEEERQRKKMMIMEGDEEGKNMPARRPWYPASAPRRRELCANQNDNPHNKVGGC
jgi:hypothetical protein